MARVGYWTVRDPLVYLGNNSLANDEIGADN
jgi:hypothetical protein